MDAIKKKHFDFLLTAMAACLFITLDVYLVPTKNKQEIITDTDAVMVTPPSGGMYQYAVYKDYIITDNGRYLLPTSVFQYMAVGDTVIISRSVITNALKSISYRIKHRTATTEINGMDISDCMFFVFVAMGGMLLFMLFYDKVAYLPGRAGLTWFFCIVTSLLIAAYVALNIFYIDL